MASVRGVMFAAYPGNAPVGPSDPSQYPKQGPHQFKPVRARPPCLRALSSVDCCAGGLRVQGLWA